MQMKANEPRIQLAKRALMLAIASLVDGKIAHAQHAIELAKRALNSTQTERHS